MKLVLLLVALVAVAFCQGAPTWPEEFYLELEFTLPYANLTHAMTVNVSAEVGATKVSFFDDLDYTVYKYPNGPQGDNVTGHYIYVNGSKNEHECISVADLSANPEEKPAIPAYLPDLNDGNWELVSRDQIVRGVKCHKWVLVDPQGDKRNSYEFFVTPTGVPMRWIQMGLNTVFGSHYDTYRFEYLVFKPHWTQPHFDAIPASLCNANKPAAKTAFNPTVALHAQLLPMHVSNPTFQLSSEAVFDEEFEMWAAKHGRKYHSMEEKVRRQEIFTSRKQWVEETNEKAEGRFGVAINHHADRTMEELLAIHGGLNINESATDNMTVMESIEDEVLPEHIDWRIDGYVDHVRDQAACGSCWTYSFIGLAETRWAIKNKKFIAFSEQACVDCFWTPTGSDGRNAGCNGGDSIDLANYLKDTQKGIAFLSEYPYLGLDNYCKEDLWHKDSMYTIKDNIIIPSGDEKALHKALSTGPVAVAIAVPVELMFYSFGIIDLPNTSELPLAHGVVLVGSGVSMDGVKYWIVRNSWSAHWGNNGYFYIKRGENQIGIANRAMYLEFND